MNALERWLEVYNKCDDDYTHWGVTLGELREFAKQLKQPKGTCGECDNFCFDEYHCQILNWHIPLECCWSVTCKNYKVAPKKVRKAQWLYVDEEGTYHATIKRYSSKEEARKAMSNHFIMTDPIEGSWKEVGE